MRSAALLLLLVMHFTTAAQHIPGLRIPLPGEERILLAELEKSAPGIDRVECLLKLSTYYLILPSEEKEDLSRTISYAELAGEQSAALGFREGQNEALVLIGAAYAEDERSEPALSNFNKAIAKINALLDEIRNTGQPEKELRSLLQLVKIFTYTNYDLAEKCIMQALNLFKAHKFKGIHHIYDRILWVQFLKANNNSALYYGLEALKAMEAAGDYTVAGRIYTDLGFIYRQIGQFQKAVDCYEIAYGYYKNSPSSEIFRLASLNAEALTKLKRPQDGIDQFKAKAKLYPPTTLFEKRELEYSLGTCYRVLKQYDSAEVHLLNLRVLKRENRNYESITDSKLIGQLYVEWGKFEQAKPYLDKLPDTRFFKGRALAHLYFLLFKTDSAAGNHLLAMQHLMKNKEIDEQLYEEAKIRENQELQLKYETEKKDKDLQIKEQNILLLTRLSQLQQKNIEEAKLRFEFDSLASVQNIQLLNAASIKKDKDILLKQQSIDLMAQQDQLQEARIYQANVMKNVTIVGLALLFIILGLLYKQYRLKQRTNKQISEQNLSLQLLVDEKEWLLKEVHHRVKNNLHTIISLLETQSAYLKDDALLAIQNSQHRVYAMSLLHQKLYQTNNATTINMRVYLPELLCYLKEMFDVEHRIAFLSEIDDIRLDISRAIPVGLILNEAVTNSIKYAFPGNRCGEVHITMKKDSDNKINLSIRDNGIGMPEDWEDTPTTSMGMKLMKGLSGDIMADFSMHGQNGTSINLVFQEDFIENEAIEYNPREMVPAI